MFGYGYVGLAVGEGFPYIDTRESDAVSSGSASVSGVGSPIFSGVGSASGSASVSGAGESIMVISRQVVNTTILQNPVDYVLAGEGKDDKLPRGKMTPRMMKKIFGE